MIPLPTGTATAIAIIVLVAKPVLKMTSGVVNGPSPPPNVGVGPEIGVVKIGSLRTTPDEAQPWT
jgi:hypothetical protein